MKSFTLTAIRICCLAVLYIGCSKNHPVTNRLPEELPGNSWIVSHFSEQGKDGTDAFNGYFFAFKQNGQLFVTKAGNSLEASWVLQENSNRFIINLGPNDLTNKPLGLLTKYWVLVDHNAGKLRLKDGDTAGNGTLEFSRQ